MILKIFTEFLQICLTTNQTCDCFEALTDPDSGCNWSATSLYSSAKTIKTQCSNTSEPGSYGACTSALKEAVTEVGKCGQSTDTTTTANTTTTATTATTATTTALSIVVLNIIVRSSQNNTAVTGAKISVNSTDGSGSVVVVDVAVEKNGTKSIEVPLAESFSLKISASGYIDETLQIDVNCTSDCQIDRYVSLSPILLPEETRIRMTWETEYPRDLDLFVLSVERSNQSNICMTFWGNLPPYNSINCTEISLDLDNRQGGLNGSETITLLNNTVNKDYVYIIAVEDYNFEDNGTLLLQSGVSVEVNNNVKSVEQKLSASSVNFTEQ